MTKSAASIGAVIWSPKEDLLVKEKAIMLKSMDTKGLDIHARDALASAIAAYAEYKERIQRIREFSQKNNAPADQLIEFMIKNPTINAVEALKKIQEPQTQPIREERKIQQPPQIPRPIHPLQREILLLREQNQKLKEELSILTKKLAIKEQKKKTSNEKQLVALLQQKEKRLLSMKKDLEQLRTALRSSQKREKSLTQAVILLPQCALVKKLKNLTKQEAHNKSSLLAAQEPFLYVENPDQTSPALPDTLKDVLLLSRKKSKGTIMLEETAVRFENEHFIFVDQAWLTANAKRKTSFFNLLDEYREQRKRELQ